MSVIQDTNLVYHSIYEKRYALSEDHVAESGLYIQKNLSELKELELQSPMTGLNLATAGTGREVKAWQAMGICNNIYHFDISSRAVEAVKSINQNKTKIHSYHLDLCCSADEFKETGPESPGVNFIYLSGVWHHLERPLAALRNLSTIANPGTLVVLRVYRAGTMRWDIVTLLRQVLDHLKPEEVVAAALKLFRNLQFGDILNNAPAYYVENFIDNILVPYCHLFDSQITTDLLEKIGITIHKWTNPESAGSTGHRGEYDVINGSTIFGTIDDPKFTANEIAKLSSHRANELNLISRRDLEESSNYLKTLRGHFEEKANQLSKDRVLQLSLFLTCLAEAPYISKRFSASELFVEAAFNEAMSELSNTSGARYSEAFRDTAIEILKNEV